MATKKISAAVRAIGRAFKAAGPKLGGAALAVWTWLTQFGAHDYTMFGAALLTGLGFAQISSPGAGLLASGLVLFAFAFVPILRRDN